jgi:hypothetical protein
LCRKVLKTSGISAVSPCRQFATLRTDASSWSHGRDYPEVAVPLYSEDSHARSRSPICVVAHTPRLSVRRMFSPISTESEADPVKWIFSTRMAQHKILILFKLNSHAKMAPDIGSPWRPASWPFRHTRSCSCACARGPWDTCKFSAGLI